MLRLLLLALALTAAWPAQAIAPLPDAVARALPDLRLAGTGRLRWYGLHIYDAALWVRDGLFDPRREFALDIRYARNVPGQRLARTSIEEMRRLGFSDQARLQHWEREMARVFPDVGKGERLTGVHRPGMGAEFYHDGRLAGVIADADFARAFFSIWLDPRTREPGLRQSLIGSR
jgi:hypothetical protein